MRNPSRRAMEVYGGIYYLVNEILEFTLKSEDFSSTRSHDLTACTLVFVLQPHPHLLECYQRNPVFLASAWVSLCHVSPGFEVWLALSYIALCYPWGLSPTSGASGNSFKRKSATEL